ncbi:nitroreductase family protein [Candidatus Woesearchaeota archaeon]|nr:nitroreductase family protein [Candidatus Woesearchaeota archaeon]
MDTLECIKSRTSIRKFTEQPVEFGKISKILEAGSRAPSAGNLQNWRFILVTEKPLLRELHNHCMQQEAIYHAQAAIIICGMTNKAERMYGLRGKRLYTVQNCACVAENMLLAAHAQGLGACWIGAFDEDKVDNLFGISDNLEDGRPQIIIALGYPAEEPKPTVRQDLASISYFNKFALKIKDPHLTFRDYSIHWQKQARNLDYASERWSKKLKELGKKLLDKLFGKPEMKKVLEKKKK